jgi:uncharacterized protein (UPF0262 family)
MSAADNRLVDVKLDEKSVVRRNQTVEHERAIALFDLMEENSFALIGHPGPYHWRLGIEDNRLILDVRSPAEDPLERVQLPLAGFRSVVRDYFQICDSYYTAIKTQSLAQIEAIDMGRRGLHNEGSEMLRDRLQDKITLDHNTARRLFTLICVLHIRG